MNLLFEQNHQHSRRLFLACLLIAVALSPLVLRLVDRSMAGLHSRRTTTQPVPDHDSSTWDLRSM